jgi:hypothetical protein
MRIIATTPAENAVLEELSENLPRKRNLSVVDNVRGRIRSNGLVS